MPEADPNRIVHCKKRNEDLPGLLKPPFPNALGKEIFENVSKEAWDEWLKESVRYINTYRVDLSSKQGQEFMVKQMRVWLGLDTEGQLAATAWTPPKDHEH